jgi:hypothetical protein
MKYPVWNCKQGLPSMGIGSELSTTRREFAIGATKKHKIAVIASGAVGGRVVGFFYPDGSIEPSVCNPHGNEWRIKGEYKALRKPRKLAERQYGQLQSCEVQ